MECPVCHVELKLSDRQGVEIDYCPKCRGVWLDRGELDKLIERAAPTERDAAPQYDRERRDVPLDDDDDFKYKNDERYRSDDQSSRPGKKKSFLGDIFDIF